MSTDVTTPPSSAPLTPPNEPTANRPIWQLVLGLVVIVAILWSLGGWAVPVVIFSILLMIVFHELGHFVTARLTGMRATEFFVGFGPRLWSKQFGDTEFGIKAYLLGGYVKIIGMTPLEEVKGTPESKTFRAATFPRRVLVASAGSLAHLLMAIVLAWAALAFFGEVSATHTKVDGFTSWVGVPQNAAQIAGLQKNDVVVAIDNVALTTMAQFQEKVNASSGVPLDLEVLRQGQHIHLTATPVDGRTITVVGETTPLVPSTSPAAGYLGIQINGVVVRSTVSPLLAIPKSFGLIWNTVWASVVGLVHIFSPSGISGLANQVVDSKAASNPTNQQSRPISIVGIADVAIKSADENPSSLLIIFMLINIGVGLINMLPMLPLDGGHVAIACYERVRSKKGQPRYVADIRKLMPVVYVFVGMLLLLFLSTLYLDLTHPINF